MARDKSQMKANWDGVLVRKALEVTKEEPLMITVDLY